MTAAEPLAADAIVHGRYRIVRQIGRGGMGAVYEAVDARLKCSVALKQMLTPSATDIELDHAFEREAQLLASLRHPGLPVVTDYFVEDGQQFLLMQHATASQTQLETARDLHVARSADVVALQTNRSDTWKVPEVSASSPKPRRLPRWAAGATAGALALSFAWMLRNELALRMQVQKSTPPVGKTDTGPPEKDDLAPVMIRRRMPATAEVVADLGGETKFSVEADAGRGDNALSYKWTVNKRPVDVTGPRFSYRPDRPGSADVEVSIDTGDGVAATYRWTVKARETAPVAVPTQIAALAPRAEAKPAMPPAGGDARRELEAWIASYRVAYEQKDVDRLAALGVIAGDKRDALRSALNDLEELKVSIAVSAIDVQGPDSAVVTLTREDRFNAGGRRQTQSINIKKTLRKTNGKWVAQ